MLNLKLAFHYPSKLGKIKITMRHIKLYLYLGCLIPASFFGCNFNDQTDLVRPDLHVSADGRFLEDTSGDPFLWMGGTTWGMSEWLNREEVDFYLDNRKDKGFNVVQVCLFWGKREDDPLRFTANPLNAYGSRAFGETEGKADPGNPLVVEGGTPESPNDYWDHVDYIIQAAKKRDMVVALLPVWGRRYVNASMKGFSDSLFSKQDMNFYGEFLGARYKDYSNIIWVLGGDVKADAGGDFLDHYRSMAEGILTGITGEEVPWNEESPYWDYALMTYHPDGTPFKNSSTWFHHDLWLDFNMIETFRHRDLVYEAVQKDYALSVPVKPTVMAEPAYEGERIPTGFSTGVQMRRQAFHSFFGGAAGFTYGAFRDSVGNGPMFSPYKGWEKLLDMEGAWSMKYVKSFCLHHNWPAWKPVFDVIQSNGGDGEFQKVVVLSKTAGECYIYFPDNSGSLIDLTAYVNEAGTFSTQWYNPASGKYTEKIQKKFSREGLKVAPPGNWSDGVFLITGLNEQ